MAESALSTVRSQIGSRQGSIQRLLLLKDPVGIKEVVANAATELDLLALIVVGADGQVIASTSYGDIGRDWREISPALDATMVDKVRARGPSEVRQVGDGLIDAYASICDPGRSAVLRPATCGFLFQRIDLGQRLSESNSFLHTQIGLIAGAMLLSSFFFALVLHRVVTVRVARILASVERFLEGDRTARSGLTGTNEISRIGNSVDRMLERLIAEEEALKESEALNRTIIDSSTYIIISTDASGMIMSFNPAAERELGYLADEVIGKVSLLSFHDPDELKWQQELVSERLGHPVPDGIETLKDFCSQLYPAQAECTYVRKDGTRIPVSLSVTSLADSSADVSGFLMVGLNTTDRKSAEEKLRLAEKVFQHAGDAILITDDRSQIIDVNPAYLKVTGFTREEVLGRNPSVASSGMHDRAFYDGMWRSIKKTGSWAGEIWDRRKNGQVYPKWLTISAVKTSDGKLSNYVGIFRDVTERKSVERELEQLAYYDSLTNLPNRSLFQDRLRHDLESANRRGENLGLLFIDLDGFKYINDTFGHEAGDQLLGEVSNRLQTCFRKSDTLARIGGDEFTVILPDVKSRSDLEKIAQNVIEALKKPINVAGHETIIGASIGISTYPEDGIDATTLLKCADAAMYWAKKEQSVNKYAFFEPTMTMASKRRVMIEQGLRRAVEGDEFHLFYQPIIDLRSGHVEGFEALLRWDHPELGTVSPAEFVPIAEEIGLMTPIGRWVLSMACREAVGWPVRADLRPYVSVNVAVKLSMDAEFVSIVSDVLEESGLAPSQLKLEITEGALIIDTSRTQRSLDLLRKLGVGVSVDDFGTGYSSLAYLKKFPIDTLKIDQSFVRDLPDDMGDIAIVESILSMARAMKMDVVAEGVETTAQRDFLMSRGCHRVQGFLYGKPMPGHAAVRMLEVQIDGRHSVAL